MCKPIFCHEVTHDFVSSMIGFAIIAVIQTIGVQIKNNSVHDLFMLDYSYCKDRKKVLLHKIPNLAIGTKSQYSKAPAADYLAAGAFLSKDRSRSGDYRRIVNGTRGGSLGASYGRSRYGSSPSLSGDPWPERSPYTCSPPGTC